MGDRKSGESNVNPMMSDTSGVARNTSQPPEHYDDVREELQKMAERRKRSQTLLQKSKAPLRPGQTLLGTFMGVYVPTTQNILGIILFIRLPWITGQAGIIQAAIIVSMGCVSSCLTSLSMSAIATNGRVSAGGCYQIIKKSLGPEFGGVVGILLFLSNNFGVAMYVLGFVEALQDAFPGITISDDQANDNRAIGAVTLIFLATIVYVGISYISKFALLFLTGVITAIFSIFLGVFVHTGVPDGAVVGLTWDNFSENIKPAYTSGNSFATLLALFFPAVTDPLAGSNLSGDLSNASVSIPPGTLYAVLTTTIIFLSQVVLTGGSTLRSALLDDKLIVTKVAWPFPELIYGGIMLSTLGAGLQSLAGAPRLLAAIARDDLVPVLRPLVPLPGQEPRKIVILCCFISMCVLMLGELDAVAPFITMWFLTCYSIINGACFMLSYEMSPGFRPAWRYFHWSAALLGMLICLGMMFFISWYFAMSALVLSFFLYKLIERQLGKKNVELVAHDTTVERSDESNNRMVEAQAAQLEESAERADWASGIRFNKVRTALLGLQEHDYEFKYWRPFVLFLCKVSPENQQYVPQRGMINLIQQLMKRGKGISFVAGVVEGDYTPANVQLAKSAVKCLKVIMREKKIDGFPEVIVAPTIYEGQRFLIQGKGFGVLRPNTVMMGFPSDLDNMSEKAKKNYVNIVKDSATAGKTLIVCKGTVDFPDGKEVIVSGTVDVWWVFDLLPARGLLLLLPYLLQQHRAWRHTKTRLFVVTGYDEPMEQLQSILEDMLTASGLQASVHILQMDASDAPRYTSVGKSSHESLTKFSHSPSIMGLTDYLHAVSLDIQDIKMETLPESPPKEEVPAEDSPFTQDPVNNRGVSHHVSQSSKEKKKVPMSEKDRRSSCNFLTSDKYGSRLTAAFKKYSADSAMVVLALPKQQRVQTAVEYLDSLSVLIADLPLVMMVQESGMERIQLYG
mmetsp:Transcript_19745/g.27363  ORF Transcript_19745/g.27363 Transcript_19745/m.27363 type:complete len:964 (+) Transcript_19745:202-3093(+)